MQIELRQYQKEIIPNGVQVLKKHYMVWLTGQERAGKTLPALGIINDAGFTNALCITTVNAGKGIKEAKALFGGNYNLDVINYESAHKVINKDKYQVIWLDESHKMGQAPTPAKRVKIIKAICQNKYIIYSTATPSGEGYYKLYYQFYLSSASPLAKWPNYYRFADEFVNKKKVWKRGKFVDDRTDVKWDKLWPMISHLFITWTREDAGFKVDAHDVLLTVKMSDEAIAIYKQLGKEKIYTHHDGRVATISGGAEMLSKLNQIGSGTLLFDDDPDGAIIDKSKAEFIKKKFAGQKIAVFYKYVAEGKLLREYFPNHTDDAALFNKRNDLIFIGHAKSFCEGVDLHTADGLVNYNIDHSATVYSQLRSRHLSLERTRPAPVYFLIPEHGIDHKIYRAVSNKINFTWTYYNEKSTSRIKNTSPIKKGIEAGRMGSLATYRDH